MLKNKTKRIDNKKSYFKNLNPKEGWRRNKEQMEEIDKR